MDEVQEFEAFVNDLEPDFVVPSSPSTGSKGDVRLRLRHSAGPGRTGAVWTR